MTGRSTEHERNVLGEAVAVHDRGLRVSDEQRLVRALRREQKVLEQDILPHLPGGHCPRDVFRDQSLVAGGGSELVERDDTEPGDNGGAPEGGVEHFIQAIYGESE